MSDRTPASPDEEPPVPVRPVRSVTPPYRGRPDRGMDVFGWGMFLGRLVLLVSFLPLIAAVGGVKKLLELLFCVVRSVATLFGTTFDDRFALLRDDRSASRRR